ncbi:hypothetical protein OAA05_01080 [bacterium]|nr:hypothetical protein [bacterium]
MNLKDIIRTVPDFPIKGIQFRDITSLLEHPEAFNKALIDLTDSCMQFKATLHIQRNSDLNKDDKIVIIDDLIATGGTAKALASLIAQCWNVPKENILVLAVIDLPDLGGSAIIEDSGFNVKTLIEFNGE